MKKNLLFLITILSLCSCVYESKRHTPVGTGKNVYETSSEKKDKSSDFYKSVAEIRTNHKEGIDFRTKYELRKSSVAVFAIHGGNIEKGTSLVAKNIAENDYSFYLFEGLQKNSHQLHITATNFDDPAALNIAESSIFALSIHVQKGVEDIICIGGGNTYAAKMMADMLISEGYPVEFPCKRLPGKSPKNIVNKTKLGGVQFEFTLPMIQKIVKNKKKLKNFSKKVRDTAEKYLNSLSGPIQQQTNE